jgi:hypothetical protein
MSAAPLHADPFLKKRTLPIESQLCVDERTSRKPAMRSPTGQKQTPQTLEERRGL